jgi:hypothetical protein
MSEKDARVLILVMFGYSAFFFGPLPRRLCPMVVREDTLFGQKEGQSVSICIAEYILGSESVVCALGASMWAAYFGAKFAIRI